MKDMRKVLRRDPVETDSAGSLVIRAVPPPVEPHAPVTPEAESVIGRRVILVAPHAWYEDVRAVSDPIRTPEGEWVIQVCDEAAWYIGDQNVDQVPIEAINTWPVQYVFLD